MVGMQNIDYSALYNIYKYKKYIWDFSQYIWQISFTINYTFLGKVRLIFKDFCDTSPYNVIGLVVVDIYLSV